jgi:SAM-dependent methyltransferase
MRLRARWPSPYPFVFILWRARRRALPGASFDALLCRNSALSYVLDTEAVIEVLRGFREALRPGGLLVLDNWNFFAPWHRFGKTRSEVREAEGAHIDYQDRHWYDGLAFLYHIDIVADVREGNRRYSIRRHDRLRAMTVEETRRLLDKAGLTKVSTYPSFDRPEADKLGGRRMVFLSLAPQLRRTGGWGALHGASLYLIGKEACL